MTGLLEVGRMAEVRAICMEVEFMVVKDVVILLIAAVTTRER